MDNSLLNPQELSFKEITSVIDNVSTFKPNVTLFGGEPLLSPNCTKIIKYIKERGMHCLMITNGFRLEDMAEEIVESGLDELNVSLDGGAELHDRIRGMHGLFKKIMDGFKKVNYYKAGKNRKNPMINLQCTITKYNYRDLEQLLDVANEANADSLTFHNLIFLDRDTLNRQKELDSMLGCSSSDWEGFVSEPGIDAGLLCEKIKKILSVKYDFRVDFYPNFSPKALMEYYGNPAHALSGNAGRCLSPWVVAYIFPDGEVRPCLNCSYSYGNVKKTGFTEIWNSEEALRFRRTLKEKKIFPVCVRCTELYRY
jgi:radical SAM protein with 4Fe4S-binding SPASM domain